MAFSDNGLAHRLFGLKDKRIIVLGGGQGMGEATCHLLGELGARVAVVDRSEDAAERVTEMLRSTGVEALPVACDVLDDDDLTGAIARIERDWGAPDGLVTIVGAARLSSSIDMKMDEWDSQIDLNLRYIFLAAREVARSLITRGRPGAMAFVGSVDGIQAAANHAAYGVAKAGLIHLVKSLAGEWSPYGVRVNVVAAGSIATVRHPRADEGSEMGLVGRLPLKRRGDMADVANALAFLLSDMARYITGQTLVVDGGHTTVGPVDYGRFATWSPDLA